MRVVGHLGALAVAIAIVGACSKYDASPSVEPVEAGADAAAGSDGSAGAPAIEEDAAPPADVEAGVRCERTAPFTSIRPVDGVNTAENEAYPRVSPDERVIYFQRWTGSTATILRASRAAVGDAFEAPAPVPGLPNEATQPSVTANELEIVFVLRGGLPPRYSLWHARRATVTDPFDPAALHPADDPSIESSAPFVSSDGSELFYTRIDTNIDLYRATRAADGGLGTREPLVTLNTPSQDSGPVLSPDGLSLYYYSERSAQSGNGSIWVAHRDRLDAPFRAPTRVEELVFDGFITAPGSVSADGCRLYFYSDKDAAETGGYDLYVAERSPP